jgi:predicted nucleic-acid-binding Zn-ribbon protein
MARMETIKECPKCGGKSWLSTSIGVMCKQCKYIVTECEVPKLPLIKEEEK